MAKIAIRGLEKSFAGNRVLRGVDLDIEEGRSLVVIGGSGVGKSVLLRIILGLIRPDKGAVEIDGVDILHLSEAGRRRRTRQIGMLFQASALFDSLKVWENVAFRLLYGEGKPRRAARAAAIDALAKVGLSPEVGELSPAELSGGMQKRVALARAVASAPKVLFFDEPTTGLDPIIGGVIALLIAERVKALGATALSITHDLTTARRIADEIAMLHEGRIIWRGPPDGIATSGNPYVDQYVHGRPDGPIRMALTRA
jgi:phospholipid/cholesterol/gamma-HCH transport system ATP-binding protein